MLFREHQSILDWPDSRKTALLWSEPAKKLEENLSNTIDHLEE